VLIRGPAGVGKSRLAKAAMADAEDEGWATLAVRGSPGLGGIPLGPFRTVLRVPGSTALPELTDSVATSLTAMRGARGLILLADDCQDLDETSSSLLQQLVTAGVIAAMLTARSGMPLPAPLTGLWTEGSVEHIELQNLSQKETSELLAAALGGSVEDTSAKRIWHLTGGNPLYLREVLLASAETGVLKEVGTEWRWRGEWAAGARLKEIVSARLGRLRPDELIAMEALALARSLPLEMVTSLSAADAVRGLEERALVTVERSGRRMESVIAHPLHAEALRASIPPLRQRSIHRNLIEALHATGARRAADRVRLACWSLESGVDVDVITLSLGAGALFGIGPAFSARLKEPGDTTAGAVVADAGDGSVEIVHHRHAHLRPVEAVRLAQAAYDRTGAVSEGVALVRAVAWTGDTDRAESVLAELAALARGVDDQLRLSLALGFVRFRGRYDMDAAVAGLIEAVESAPESASPALVAEIYALLAEIAFTTGRPAVALDYALRAAQAEGVELDRSGAAPAAASALSSLGRGGEALAIIDQALPVASESGQPLALAVLLFTRAITLARMGELEQARRLAEWLREVALSEGRPGHLSEGMIDTTAGADLVLGEILCRQGRPASAAELFRDAAGLFSERDIFGFRPWALAGLALAKAQTGEQEAATAALEEARHTHPGSRDMNVTRYLAEIELHGLAGRRNEALQIAAEAVAWGRETGIVDCEAQALEASVRVAPSAASAERLATLAATTDSKLVKVLADHARALVAADAPSLLEAGQRFAALTAWRMAAEAAVAAVRIFDRRGESRASQAASRAAAGYKDHCEATLPPATAGTRARSARLTRREREIALHAAAGRSSKEIAERMDLSRRTVENHLYRAYMKLGVTDRQDLASALQSVPPQA
jgi:DNA-binding CsgD family transcriptional regulator/tetratricopeptide (TPR) repeat protein